jgi:hypothetical protein
MKTLQGRGKVCPNCGMRDTRPSRRTWFEFLLLPFLLCPYRCRVCGTRFWRLA